MVVCSGDGNGGGRYNDLLASIFGPIVYPYMYNILYSVLVIFLSMKCWNMVFYVCAVVRLSYTKWNWNETKWNELCRVNEEWDESAAEEVEEKMS